MKKMDFNKTLKGKPMERKTRHHSDIDLHKAAGSIKAGHRSKQPAATGRGSPHAMSISNADNALQLVLSNVDAAAKERVLGVVKKAVLKARESQLGKEQADVMVKELLQEKMKELGTKATKN